MVDKLANLGKRPNNNKQGNINNSSNVIVVEDLVKAEVIKEDVGVDNIKLQKYLVYKERISRVFVTIISSIHIPKTYQEAI